MKALHIAGFRSPEQVLRRSSANILANIDRHAGPGPLPRIKPTTAMPVAEPISPLAS
jgi:hypothetical protein